MSFAVSRKRKMLLMIGRESETRSRRRNATKRKKGVIAASMASSCKVVSRRTGSHLGYKAVD